LGFYLKALLLFFPLTLNAPIENNKSDVSTPLRTYAKGRNFDDIELMVRCVSSESGNCYTDAYRVAQTIDNRTRILNKSLREVIYQKGQFCGLNSNWFNTTDKTHLDTLKTICANVLSDNIPDSLRITKETIFFINPRIARGKFATNLKKRVPVAISSNNHYYYENTR
jgi:hypothetical protein